MRAFPIPWACHGAWLLVVAGCGEMTAPPLSSPSFNFNGHYTGRWSVGVFNPEEECSVWGWGECHHSLVANLECPTVFDVNMTGDSTFAGTFTGDTSSCVETLDLNPGEPSPTPYLAFGDVGRFAARADSFATFDYALDSGELAEYVYVRFEMVIGSGGKDDLESLLGCTPSEWIGGEWLFIGNGGDAPNPQVPSGLGAHAVPKYAWESQPSSSGFWDEPFSCGGRTVLLNISFHIERT